MDFNALVEAIVASRVMTSRHSLSEAANDRVRQMAKLITVYRPDPNRWVNWRIRK
ncbi:hypothetical protein K9N68_15290 [Kovacikia minuta CCNUW1]|uniref:hypothetical protein n=1 Tax=Kovacikia minuta TaxID=2931930 RepID=UPI001CCD82D1|nr:hypothetical protein [Kovacikia minuta]UBF29075.1 hypothetical protein K9N68_15290 [Kovacikia minuta CCNUW1]